MNMMGSPWQRLSQLSPEEMAMLQAMVGQDGPPMDPAMYDQMKNEVAGARAPTPPNPAMPGPGAMDQSMAADMMPPPMQPQGPMPTNPMDQQLAMEMGGAHPGAPPAPPMGPPPGAAPPMGGKDAMLAKIMAMIGG